VLNTSKAKYAVPLAEGLSQTQLEAELTALDGVEAILTKSQADLSALQVRDAKVQGETFVLFLRDVIARLSSLLF
jgi:hypothetical protein